MSDLIDEIDQDLKDEKHHQIVKKITKFFIITAAAIILGVALYVWEEYSTGKLQEQLGNSFNQAAIAVSNNQLDEAISHLDEVIKYSHQQYAGLAYLNKAAILSAQNKHSEAQSVLLEVGEYNHFDKAIRELAQITYLGNQLNSGQADSENTSEMLSNLTKEDKPWRLIGLQTKALYDIKNNNIVEAKASLNEILVSKQATKSIHDVTSSILASISKTE